MSKVFIIQVPEDRSQDIYLPSYLDYKRYKISENRLWEERGKSIRLLMRNLLFLIIII